jgi:hypothetical protein
MLTWGQPPRLSIRAKLEALLIPAPANQATTGDLSALIHLAAEEMP